LSRHRRVCTLQSGSTNRSKQSKLAGQHCTLTLLHFLCLSVGLELIGSHWGLSPYFISFSG
jgi:hypothetical protein